jgi:hypothetical protein
MRLRLSAAVAGAAMLVFVLVPMASAAVPTAAQRDAVRHWSMRPAREPA